MIHNKFRYLLTLVALFALTAGAWAKSYEAKVFDVPASWAQDNTHISAADLPKDFVQITKDEAKALAVPDGDVVLVYGFVGENVLVMAFDNGTAIPNDDDDGAPVARGNFIMFQTMAKVCYTTPAGPKVAWNASTKTGTFLMPAFDVEIAPIYAKAAAFATTGTEPEVKTLLPEAAEGVIAGTDASLIAEGTGIVAFAGESTDVTQGTLMYATSTSATEAPALEAFSATVPTAKDVADDGATVYVWYYIQGANAPANTEATEDNTFNDTEPACLTVQVLTNKFDIQFNAANANTIEAGKATVTVGGTAATVTEGKLEGVKMGSEVKVKANTGYKFRKVEVKKKAVGPAEGKTYTNLQGGEVLHVGDKITETEGKFRYTHHSNPQSTDYYTYIRSFNTYEVLRANVVYEDYNYKYTESPDGQYYVLKHTYYDDYEEEWFTAYYFNQDLPVTETSDGITVTLDGQDAQERNLYTFWVHEPNQ